MHKIDRTYKGIILSSRRGLDHEYKAMARVVDAIPELMARRVESIWCDSCACVTYTVIASPGLYAPELPWSVRDAFRAVGGYNGISVYGDKGQSDEFDTYWPEYDRAEFDGPMPTPEQLAEMHLEL
jgi:hypothetical protein